MKMKLLNRVQVGILESVDVIGVCGGESVAIKAVCT